MEKNFSVLKPEGDSIPIALFGDEVQVFDGLQYMAINWSSEVSPVHTNARISRFLVVLLPTTGYHMNGKINVTLQVRSCNKLFSEGVCGLKATVSNLRGDWKYLCQLLNAKRMPGTNRICFKCTATKNMEAPMTDLSTHALWRVTELDESEIWHEPPTVCSLIGFSTRLICPDVLHTYHLGIGRDVCSSILVLLLKRGVFAGNNVPC